MCHEPFTSTWQWDWEAGGKPEASFSLIRYLPLLLLFYSSSPKCLTSVNKKYRQQVQARHLPTCRSHLAALEDRVLQCTTPSSPVKAVLSIFCCPLACHSATQLRNHVLTARAQGKGTLWGSLPRMELWVEGGWRSSRQLPPAMLASPWADQVTY